ncbi:hydrolase [Rhizobium rhizosphaerae]|uniref:Hydrolase n=1 Tax=Xaviernesmea rhizosphaerae TaxID=1672749 RepID=A0A1Q9AL12_9HYPH|nr:HD family hydrolase [Xaviernesmea rhizosphaerae]OLP55961.1 hydrolase [Xaviernesmea rhizosphaerae]
MSAPRAWQRMLSGRRLDLLDPSPLDIELSDIAHGLARVARWNGQTAGPHAFSVAQHCVVVEEIFRRLNKASPADRLIALLHDAPEYVIGDMISPFKAVVGGGYKTVEKRIEAAIHLRFGLPASATAALTEKIKKADRVAAFFEATLLAGFSPTEAAGFFGRPRAITAEMLPMAPLPAPEAQALFAERFHAIDAERLAASPRAGQSRSTRPV